MAQAPAAPVVLSCGQASDIACAAMAAALEARTGQAPARSGAGQLHVELQMTRVQENFLEGRLTWRRGDAPAVTGPLLELSVMDRSVSDRDYRQLADGLIRISDLPL